MNQLFFMFCMSLPQTYIQGSACNAAINATYTKTSMEKEINVVTDIYKKKGTDIYNNNKTLIDGGVLVGGIYDTIHKQELKIAFPVTPIVNNVSVDVKPNQVYTYNLEWKWSF